MSANYIVEAFFSITYLLKGVKKQNTFITYLNKIVREMINI